MDVGILCAEGTGPVTAGGPVKRFVSSSLYPLNPYTFICLIAELSLQPGCYVFSHRLQFPPVGNNEPCKHEALINPCPTLGEALEQIFIKDDSVSFFPIKHDRNPSGL